MPQLRRSSPGALFRSCMALSAFTLSLPAHAALAQSGTRVPQGRVTIPADGSASRNPASRSVGLDGYCPVCIVEMKKWVKGSAAIQASYDGKTYYFPVNEQRDMFLADPAKYAPVLGGDCVVCYAHGGQRMPGSVYHTALSGKRLFLFPDQAMQQEFLAHAAKYANADLAAGGNCAVCRVEANQDVPGKPEIAAMHRGLRYLFPSQEQRAMFLANPTKYEVLPAESNGSSNRPR